MIDVDVVKAGLAALGVAAGELIEDQHDELVSALPKTKALREKRFRALGELAADLMKLAEAGAVLLRRGE